MPRGVGQHPRRDSHRLPGPTALVIERWRSMKGQATRTGPTEARVGPRRCRTAAAVAGEGKMGGPLPLVTPPVLRSPGNVGVHGDGLAVFIG